MSVSEKFSELKKQKENSGYSIDPSVTDWLLPKGIREDYLVLKHKDPL